MSNIIIVCICVSLVRAVVFGGRSNEKSPPCFANDEEPPARNVTYESFIPKVIDEIRNLNSRVESRIHYMNTEYCIAEENGSFLDTSTNSFTDNLKFLHDFNSSQSSFLETMREHYDTLNLLANYLEQLSQTANDDSSEESLVKIQNRVYEVMCPIKIILRWKNQDPVIVVPSGNLSDIFILYHQDSTRCEQQILEYVTVSDSKRTAKYLESMYTTVLTFY